MACEYDIVVAGAGVAGVAAALAAARAGKRTALVEKTILPGGLATSGLIYVYLPICDGNGRQVLFGLAEELLKLSIRYGPGEVPSGWRTARNAPEAARYRTAFSPASFVLAMDEALEQAGVEVWLDSLICGATTEGGRITGIELENKSGRIALRGRCFVDATGDADVAFLAGAPCAEADNWLAAWALQASLDRARKAVADKSGACLLDVLIRGAFGAGQPPDVPKLCGVSGRDVSRFAMRSRRMLREHFAAAQTAGGSSRQDIFPVALPSMAQFRTSRRIVGRATLGDGQDGRRFDDSIGLAPDWRRPGPVWELPFGSMVPHGIRGVLAAGRCISAEADAWEITRVIPVAAHTGQVAGLAAAMAVEADTTPDALNVSVVQQCLRDKGIPVHLEDVGLPTGR